MHSGTYLLLTALIALSGCAVGAGGVDSAGGTSAAAGKPGVEEREGKSVAPTLNTHPPTLEKILGNSGISLQWLSWEAEDRGQLETAWVDGTLYLKGTQKIASSAGSLSIDGRVVAVTEDAFTFNGRIAIADTPDAGRQCIKEGVSEFAITQGRKYFRLREFEWCDELTDYVDIYF